MDQSLRTRMVRDRSILRGVRGVTGTRYSDTTSTYALGRAGGISVCCNGTSAPPNAPLITDTDVSDGTVFIYIGGRAITAYAYSIDDPSGAITDVSYNSPIIITGLTNGTAYTFYVRAKNEAGYSEPTSTGPLTPVGPPSAPVLSTPIVGNNQLSVPFTIPADGGSAITGYMYTLDGVSYTSLGLVTSPAIITGLTNGTTYTVNLKATNAIGDSAASNTVSGTPIGIPPAPPSGLSATVGDGEVTITFTPGNDNSSAISNYQYTLNGNVASPTYVVITPPTGPVSSVTITGLTNGTSYYFRLKAVNDNGVSVPSSLLGPVVPTGAPAPPTALSGVGGNQAIYVLFTAGSNGGSPITNYEYSVDGGSTFTAFSPAQTTSPVEISGIGLTNGANYTVLLKAVNSAGAGIASSSIVVMPTTNTLNATNRLINMDASVPASYSGSGTTWTNLDSGGSYSATLVSTPTFDNANKWFTFNGTNQIAEIAAAVGINPTAGTPFTVQIWARVNTASPNFTSGDGLISKQFGPGSFDGYSLTLNTNTSLTLNMNGASVNGNYGSSTSAYNNDWALYTIVVYFGGGSGNPSYTYVSTRRVVTANNAETFMPSQAPLQFPRGMQEGAFNYCPADVGAFYLYNTALSQENIIRNYDATKSRYGL